MSSDTSPTPPQPWTAGDAAGEGRKHAPATLRNREPIAGQLRTLLPAKGVVLEIASGSGEHAAWIAPQFAGITWQPSDYDVAALGSIAEWGADIANVRPPLRIDVTAPQWPIAQADAIFCANMIHIAPWTATLGLMAGAGRLLPTDAPLILYGPFRRADVPTAPSNEAFDQSLKSRDSDWGLRDLEDVDAVAAENGLRLERVIEMPSNNLMVVWRRR